MDDLVIRSPRVYDFHARDLTCIAYLSSSLGEEACPVEDYCIALGGDDVGVELLHIGVYSEEEGRQRYSPDEEAYS